MIQFYDYSLDTFLNATVDLINNGSVSLSTLQSHVSKVLSVKYDLGLFKTRYISENINSQALTEQHVPLTLEAAQKSIVLLENRNSTLPLQPIEQDVSKIALIGPFSDSLNYVSLLRPFSRNRNLCRGREITQVNTAPTRRPDLTPSANPCSRSSLPTLRTSLSSQAGA
jgi:beta-glucosidase-like glycosyl hydrolase